MHNVSEASLYKTSNIKGTLQVSWQKVSSEQFLKATSIWDINSKFQKQKARLHSDAWAGNLGSIPGLGRSPAEGKGYPLQDSSLENSNMDYTVLENPRDGGAWWAAVYGVTESDMTEAT